MVKTFVAFVTSLFLALPALAAESAPPTPEPQVGLMGVALFFGACAVFIIWFIYATVKASKKAAEEKK